MGCTGCSIDGDGTPRGCGDNGHCSTGGCNKRNTYDWLSNVDIQDPMPFGIVEVSFKRGARKDFFKVNPQVEAITGDLVTVEAETGYDVGRISLSGDLVRLQMRKKRHSEDRVMHKVLRVSNFRDKERLVEARAKEQAAMVKSRAIARSLGLEMKIGDVEYQGDNRKATFYYTADGRVDFRELVRAYANEFRVKIEMRQIGSRQESARIGGLGPCGRELCCSTWLSDFKSVSTSAARYQNLAINQTKLSGQCGRLKCCLNYELDSYLDALETFPKKADVIRTKYHKYELVKTDIFKGLMYYIQIIERGRGPIIAMDKERVIEILALNKKKEYPEELGVSRYATVAQEKDDLDYEDVTGQIELPALKKRSRNQRKKRDQKGRRGGQSRNRRGSKNKAKGDAKKPNEKQGERSASASSDKPASKKSRSSNKNRRKKNHKPRPPKGDGPKKEK
jgi:Uncharacterized homolog of PSP1